MDTSYPLDELIRLSAILAPDGPIPISKTSWWLGVRAGRFPQPMKLGPRTTVWRRSAINALIANPENWKDAA